MKTEQFKLTVNGKFAHEMDAASLASFDLVDHGDGHFHILKDGRSYQASLVSLDRLQKKAIVALDGQPFQVDIADSFDQLVDKMGLSASVTHRISEIRAPMPGLVLSISVVPGQALVHGDPLLILEAMKMENVIKSPGEGVVKKIVATKGKAVEKGEVLIELE